jgi:hypothetical protein
MPNITPRYADRFLNALMDPHHIFVEAQLWYDDILVDTLPLVSGSVSADRAGVVRRTATLALDPTVLANPTIAARLNPLGSIVKLWRGIRYPDNTAEYVQIFTGRIDVVETALNQVGLQCSDMASFVVDDRFFYPWQPYFENLVVDEVQAAIEDINFLSVVIDDTSDVIVGSGITYEEERAEAVSHLLKSIGLEWEADVDGVIHIKKLPAVIDDTTLPVWIIDSGDAGVLIDTTKSVDRQGVANIVTVTGEPEGGTEPAVGDWWDLDDTSPTYVYGPYGKVAVSFSGQTLRTTQAAVDRAAEMGAQLKAKTDQVQVTCVPNPKLKLGDVVRVFSARRKLDKMYYVQSFEMPLDPETPMTMTLFQTLTEAGTVTVESGMLRAGSPSEMVRYGPSPLQVPEGSTWEPTPLT